MHLAVGAYSLPPSPAREQLVESGKGDSGAIGNVAARSFKMRLVRVSKQARRRRPKKVAAAPRDEGGRGRLGRLSVKSAAFLYDSANAPVGSVNNA